MSLTNEFLNLSDKYHLNMKFKDFETSYEENYYTEELFTKYEQYTGLITYTYDGIYLQADGNNLYGFATRTEHTFNIIENFNDNFQIYKEDTTYYIMFGSHTWDKSPYSYIIKSLENLDLIEKPFEFGKTTIEVLDIPNGTLITKTFDYDTELIIEYIPTTIEEGYMKVNQTGIIPGSLDRTVNITLKAHEELRIEVYGSGELIINEK